MDWVLTLIIIFIAFVILLLSGLPVAFVFIIINFLGVAYFMGSAGFEQSIISIFSSLAHFTLVPVPMFTLMGAILFHSGIITKVLDVLGHWLGRLPGRLSLIAVGSGAIFSNLSGSTMANTAILGTTLVPEMEKRGYKKSMSLGPILGTGGLAMIIPPSTLAIILGSIGEISIGRLLIGGIIPGFLMAALYGTYIVIRCQLQPHIAPVYDIEQIRLSKKILILVRDAIPMVFIVFMVLGTIFIGFATPTEAASLGAVGSIILAAIYRKLTREVVLKSLTTTVTITVMVLLIIACAVGFSQILAYSGVSRSLVEVLTQFDVAPIFILLSMMLVVVILGTFMEQISMMMVALPIYMPIVNTLGFDPIWFGIVMLICLEIGLTTPPFGMLCFVMKGVAPKGTTMKDIYLSAIPFILCDIIAIFLLMTFPVLITFLPNLMK